MTGRMGKGVVWVIVGVFTAIVAGCCRTSGPSHKCDFTPIEQATDGGSDGPMLCGTELCEGGEVCCYTKAPANATCIPPSRFVELRCEKLELACSRPGDCPGGSVVSCCLKVDETGPKPPICEPTAACVLGGGYLACETDSQCPSSYPACTQVGEQPNGDPFNVCK